MKKDESIEDTLINLIGHKVTIVYTGNLEGTLRETAGILEDVNKTQIKIRIHDSFGESVLWFLNRHSCNLMSVVDEGVPNGKH